MHFLSFLPLIIIINYLFDLQAGKQGKFLALGAVWSTCAGLLGLPT